MMKLWLWGLTGLFFCMISGCSPGESEPEKTKEVRGVWITNIDSDVMFSADSIRAAMKELSDQGFNVVFPVVLNDGYTLYPSEVMEETFGEAYRIDSILLSNKIDPLQEIVIEAQRYGMDVIPWFEFGFASSYKQDGGHILASKPEWAARDKEGNLLKKNNFEWMNGIHPEVQDFVQSLILEVIEKYDVDGIQGDDRLPAMPAHGGYSDYTRKLYKNEMGVTVPEDPADSTFMRWKADKLNAFQSRLYEKVKERGEHLIVSTSPSVYPWSYDNYLQDSPIWYENGTTDLLIPQNYRYDIESYKSTLDQILEVHPGVLESETVLASGILIKAGPRYNNFEYVVEAIRYNREKGVPGEVYFFYEGLDEKNENLGDSLAASWYKEPAQLPWRNADYQRQIVEKRVQPGEMASFDIDTKHRWSVFTDIAGGSITPHNKQFKLVEQATVTELENGWQKLMTADSWEEDSSRLIFTNTLDKPVKLLLKELRRK